MLHFYFYFVAPNQLTGIKRKKKKKKEVEEEEEDIFSPLV
jgi:hypothetical protein